MPGSGQPVEDPDLLLARDLDVVANGDGERPVLVWNTTLT